MNMTSNFEFFKRRRVDGQDKKGGTGCNCFHQSVQNLLSLALLAKVVSIFQSFYTIATNHYKPLEAVDCDIHSVGYEMGRNAPGDSPKLDLIRSHTTL
eukprot:scaffold18443_cov142-Skeletonema_marinoi.AAC.6